MTLTKIIPVIVRTDLRSEWIRWNDDDNGGQTLHVCEVLQYPPRHANHIEIANGTCGLAGTTDDPDERFRIATVDIWHESGEIMELELLRMALLKVSTAGKAGRLPATFGKSRRRMDPNLNADRYRCDRRMAELLQKIADDINEAVEANIFNS